MLIQMPKPDLDVVLRLARDRQLAYIAGAREAIRLYREAARRGDEEGNPAMAKWARQQRRDTYERLTRLRGKVGFKWVFQQEWRDEASRLYHQKWIAEMRAQAAAA